MVSSKLLGCSKCCKIVSTLFFLMVGRQLQAGCYIFLRIERWLLQFFWPVARMLCVVARWLLKYC